MSYTLLLLAVQHCIGSFAAPYGDWRGGYERLADHGCGELAAVGLVVEPLLRAEGSPMLCACDTLGWLHIIIIGTGRTGATRAVAWIGIATFAASRIRAHRGRVVATVGHREQSRWELGMLVGGSGLKGGAGISWRVRNWDWRAACSIAGCRTLRGWRRCIRGIMGDVGQASERLLGLVLAHFGHGCRIRCLSWQLMP